MIEVDIGTGVLQVSINDGTGPRETEIGTGQILVELANEGPQGPSAGSSVNGYFPGGWG